MYGIGQFLLIAVDIYIWIIVGQVVISWLLAFDVINARNPQAQNLIGLLRKITDPVYKPVRKYIPPIAGIDITPLIVIFGLTIISRAVIVPLFLM